MRILIFTIIILLFPLGSTRSQDRFNAGNRDFENGSPEEIINNNEEGSVEEDFLSLEPDIFSRKLFQKNLKALPSKDKVKWSFRMANTDIFL